MDEVAQPVASVPPLNGTSRRWIVTSERRRCDLVKPPPPTLANGSAIRKQKEIIHSRGANTGVFRPFNFKSRFHLQSDKEVIPAEPQETQIFRM